MGIGLLLLVMYFTVWPVIMFSILVQPSAAALLEPIQLAQSHGGCERALHFLQATLECKSEDSILSVDFSNAFNTLRRDVLLSRTFSEPQLSPLWRLAHWAYRSSTDLLLVRSGEVVDTILSAEGRLPVLRLAWYCYC